MSKTTTELPFTELVERVIEITRAEAENGQSRARGAINDAYCREIPSKEDWSFLLASSSLTTEPRYATGTVTVNTQQTNCVFSTDASVPTALSPARIKFSGNDNVYEFARTNATGGTITPALSGATNVTNGSYTLYQSLYALAPDFERFPKNGGAYTESGGKRTMLKEYQLQTYYEEVSPSPALPTRCRVVAYGTINTPYIELIPPQNQRYVIPYDYLRKLPPMFETTAGVATVNIGSTVVVGSAATTRFTEAETGFFFRITNFGDAEDSEWYRVIGITHDSSMTLQSAFGLSGATIATYALSAVPLMPARLHIAIMAGAIKTILADQNDPIYQYWDGREREAINDAKRLYKTRVYQQEVALGAEDYHFRR